jgi:hypothetical protein
VTEQDREAEDHGQDADRDRASRRAGSLGDKRGRVQAAERIAGTSPQEGDGRAEWTKPRSSLLAQQSTRWWA